MNDRSPPLVKAALLDANGVFLRMEELPESQLTNRHLADITECDLPANKYSWNPAEGRFDPLPVSTPTKPAAQPDVAVALALGFAALASATKVTLPKTTQQWIDTVLNTLDAKGAK